MNSSTEARLPPLRPGLAYEIRRTANSEVCFAPLDSTAGERFLLRPDELGQVGPAIRSPGAWDSLGSWLQNVLADAPGRAWWCLIARDGGSFDIEVAAGVVRLRARELLARPDARRFRHDARGLLNSIGMNSDLIGMHARGGGLTAIGEAAERISTSTKRLTTLVADWSQASCRPGPISARASVPILLTRAGVATEVVIGEGYPESGDTVPAAYSEALARMFAFWVFQCSRGERPVLHFQPDQIRLENPNPDGTKQAGRYSLWFGSDAAEPELASIDPAEALRGMGVGFGAWQASDSAGICAGIPAD